MIDESMSDETPHQAVRITEREYREALQLADAAVCEALAVAQAASGREAPQHQILGTVIFARLCAHASAFMRAAPLSRWSRSDWVSWEFSAVAGHARAILEGVPLFSYVSATPDSDDEWFAKLWLLHLCDCTKRIQLAESGYFVSSEELEGYRRHSMALKGKLQNNAHFSSLPSNLQSRLLKGKHMMLWERAELLQAVGTEEAIYNSLFDVLSHYTHILPMSFYRMEPEGRGSGLDNDTDRAYIFLALRVVGALIGGATDDLVEMFPDTAAARQGVRSKFSPGPRSNLPTSQRTVEPRRRRRRVPKRR